MPTSRYTPSSYGDIDSGGWDNPLPRPHRYTAPTSQIDHEPPRGRGQLRAPSIESDNWSPAPTRSDPVRIEPPKSNGGDDWGSNTPSNNIQVSQSNDDGGGWDAPAPAPPASISRSNGNGNGNGNGNNFSVPQHRAQQGHRSRYDDDEDYINEEDEMIPPPSTEPVHGAYVAWTGVTYQDPSKNVADPPTLEELLEVLEPMRIERERRQAIRDGTAPPGGSGRDCFNCGQPGHISADCQEPKKPREGGGGGACYECGEDGHQSRDCPSKAGGGGGGGCFNCGEDGHFSRECPNEKVERGGYGGGGMLCYNCGEDGHMSRDCVNEKVEGLGDGGGGGGSCYNCGEAGHLSRDCTNEKVEREGGGGYGGGSILCYNCGEEGHMSRDCVNERVAGVGGGGGGTCYNCGEAGHMSRDCTEPPVPGSFRGECHNCGEKGHQSRECDKPRVPGSFRGECHNCGETGHQSRDCEKPRNYDRGVSSGGGGGYGTSNNNGNGGGGGGDDWGTPAPAASGWGGEESTPALVADTSAGDDWGTPQSTVQTPAANSGWNRSGPATAKTQDDDWGTPAPFSTPAHASKHDSNDWGTPATAQESPAPPRAAPGIHPSRLAMLGGKGAGAEYSSPSRNQTQGPSPREVPPHVKATNGTGNGYGATAERPAEQPRVVKEEPKVIPVENNEFGGW